MAERGNATYDSFFEGQGETPEEALGELIDKLNSSEQSEVDRLDSLGRMRDEVYRSAGGE